MVSSRGEEKADSIKQALISAKMEAAGYFMGHERMSSVLRAVSFYYVICTIFVFNVVGVFGNVQLLWTTYRKKFAHCKSGMLLAMNAFYHTVCLLSELVNATYLILGQRPTRRTCYNFMMAYIFAMCQQAVMMTMISVDLLLVLIFPIWYRIYPTKHYLIIIFVVCTTFALPFSVWAWIGQDDEVVPFCSPPAGRSSTNFNTKLTLRRIKVIVLIYLCSWFASISLVYCLQSFEFSAEDLIAWQSDLVLFNLVTFSQTFYVCIWRSAEYRTAFKEQLMTMFFRASVSSTSTSAIHPSKIAVNTTTL
ncbi:hypothetical protein GCK32_012650 [Trichostrongylus colubriformis]|uniref:G-protein coupled receptors family 1 profile domain-containing protein n=1 Tax=Trichostrongylus colubriformis TaxID=6319 RepID=A0AAN8ID91_TRICO